MQLPNLETFYLLNQKAEYIKGLQSIFLVLPITIMPGKRVNVSFWAFFLLEENIGKTESTSSTSLSERVEVKETVVFCKTIYSPLSKK